MQRLTKKIKKLTEKISNKENKNTENNPLSPYLEKNKKRFEDIFNDASDIIFRELKFSSSEYSVNALIIYVDGLVDSSLISKGVLNPIMTDSLNVSKEKLNSTSVFENIKERFLAVGEINELEQINCIVDFVLSGCTALIIDGFDKALMISAKGWETRALEEPEAEPIIRGPREGFTENIRVNTAQLRRRIRTSRFKIETMKIGSLTKTDVFIAYIKGIVNDKVVDEVKKRLKRIKTDSILESCYIEELIEDEPYTPFAQMSATERPDKVSAGLLEGQVAILVDNTPFVLVVPYTFPQFLQASEDYYNRYTWSSFLRILRFISLNIALLLPSIYVAVTTYHQEMIPTPLLISIASAREGLPFPAFVEAIIMETIFEILREAGVRLPRPVGQAVSIVGALVIGEAAVTAGLISPAIVIVVALTAIASFAIPSLEGTYAIRLVRFPIIFLAGALGLFGVITALLILLIHLCSLRSFGVPFLSPIAPLSIRDLKDSFLRFPWWAMFTRPRLIGYKEPARQKYKLKPEPPASRNNNDNKGGN